MGMLHVQSTVDVIEDGACAKIVCWNVGCGITVDRLYDDDKACA